ncbi:hypothetical protein O1D23_003606 [Vibrio cholerae]|uniref:DUF6161 domain-containing protein n=2 Tax=Vibrio cholerae TaxID=666 RepID=UPI000DBE1ECD|nr:DUF6161 domain-containing protein [Vibrio cholerae]EKF9832059.1 hypothetical protein [Vibrio cholerae]RAL30453.1 hypothetical protein DOE54_01495 [Vibrio cholerae]GHZ06868.1 hypothetical protein VCSRO76_3115 [Vibrio cholerae]HDI3197062.1 hypothetical protein [Vibrio cholerae]
MSKEFKIVITDATEMQFDFSLYEDFYKFCESERDWWKEKESLIKSENKSPTNYTNVASYFDNLLSQLAGFKIDEWDQHTIDQHISNLKRYEFNVFGNSWLWSGHSFSEALVNCNISYDASVANHFIIAVIGKQKFSISNKDSLIGAVLAYEFFVVGSSITSRTDAELTAMETVRKSIQEHNSKLREELEVFKGNFSEWVTSTKTEWSNWEQQQVTKISDADDERCTEFMSFMNDCKVRIEDLESAYQEKLRLEKPAEYWKKSARKYGIQGSLWAVALVASSLMGIVYFHDFFSSWLLGQKLKVELSSLHGALIFASILTVYAFLIKTLSKLTFSSFHLMRDAEEREQLTYLFLSLNKDSQLDSTSRNIVLQALFSRTDTGLLAGDSSPSMPGLSELINTSLKSK